MKNSKKKRRLKPVLNTVTERGFGDTFVPGRIGYKDRAWDIDFYFRKNKKRKAPVAINGKIYHKKPPQIKL